MTDDDVFEVYDYIVRTLDGDYCIQHEDRYTEAAVDFVRMVTCKSVPAYKALVELAWRILKVVPSGPLAMEIRCWLHHGPRPTLAPETGGRR
jgi:hypothetical protein